MVMTMVRRRQSERNISSVDKVSGSAFTTHLSFTVGPHIDCHADHIVQRCVRALVQQHCHYHADRVDGQTRFDRSMETGIGNEAEGPFPCETDEAKHEVEDLERGHRLHGSIEILSEEVPENLGPEESLDRRSDLVCEEREVGQQ